MFFVYILENQKDHEWYIGYTDDIDCRPAEHERGQTRSTANRGPFVLIYYEAYLNKMDALGREKFLKSGAGHRFVKKQLSYYFGK
ncbi:MAG: GIY-YIG nuclease family protein [Patescibacteria group bacterium]